MAALLLSSLNNKNTIIYSNTANGYNAKPSGTS